MTGNMDGASRRSTYAEFPDLGMLLSPLGWRYPWCRFYGLDNDVFTNREKPGWWETEGEARWLKMLDRVPRDHPPLWVLLPDVVADWEQTIEQAHRYRAEVEGRGFKTALALQDGCNFKDVIDFGPDCVFVGGSTLWKWTNTERIINVFGGTCWVHVGRVNGTKRIRLVKQWGADSADGTGLCKFFDAILPKVIAGLYEPDLQLNLF